jgi:membrane dipeptidase
MKPSTAPLLTLLFCALCAQAAPASAQPTLDERVAALLKDTPLIDGHNDVAWQLRKRARNQLSALNLAESTKDKSMHTDIERIRAGGLGGQFWSVYVPASLGPSEAVQATLEQIDVVKRMARRYPETFELAFSADELVAAHKRGKVASLIGMEGGYSMGHSLGVLRQLYELGARYMTLTHSKTLPWADSATDEPQHEGLSPFGRGRPRDEPPRDDR